MKVLNLQMQVVSDMEVTKAYAIFEWHCCFFSVRALPDGANVENYLTIVQKLLQPKVGIHIQGNAVYVLSRRDIKHKIISACRQP